MTQITGIGFSNFRVFSKPTFFDLAPISIFTGTNSSGKSSIFKGLYLITSNSNKIEKLDFSGNSHNLGTFQLAKNRSAESNQIRFLFELDNKSLLVFDFKPREGDTESGEWSQISVSYNADNKDVIKDHDLLLQLINEGEEVKLIYNIKHVINEALSSINKGVGVSESSPFYDVLINSKNQLKDWGGNIFSIEKVQSILPYSANVDGKILTSFLNEKILTLLSHSALSVKYFDEFERRYRTINFEDVLKYFKQQFEYPEAFNNTELKYLLVDSKYDELIPLIGNNKFSEIFDDLFHEQCKKVIAPPLSRAFDSFKHSTRKVDYIEAVRANSQRVYSNLSQGTSFNDLLLKIGQSWPEDLKSGTDEVLFVEKWMKKFGIGEKLNISRIKGIATEVSIVRDGVEIDLIDLGYGVTQFLPILLYIIANIRIKSEFTREPYFDDSGEVIGDEEVKNREIYQKNGPLLLIEEPESNLHPKLQSLLADFLIDVAKTFEVTLLIETHSEYLIRRLQVLTASGEIKPEDSVIYYLDGNIPSDSDKFIRKININPDGSLTNDFGSGFIDEATNWKMELMRLKNAQLQNLN